MGAFHPPSRTFAADDVASHIQIGEGIDMTIMELGALGEFVGAFAVVATLAYLAVQVRHSKSALNINSQETRAATTQAFWNQRCFFSLRF